MVIRRTYMQRTKTVTTIIVAVIKNDERTFCHLIPQNEVHLTSISSY